MSRQALDRHRAGLRVVNAPIGLEDLGPWRARPVAVSFGPETTPNPTIFRLDLPGGIGAADGALDVLDGWAGATLARLDTIPDRLNAALAQVGAGVSFDATAMAPADAWLMSRLRDPAAVAFGVGDTVKTALRAIIDMATKLAWVETRIDGALLARTRISIGGDIDTVAKTLITPADLQIHLRSVAAARASKNAWMRIMAMVTNVARALAKFASNPVAGVMALPQAWQYIRRILAEAKLL